MGALNLRKRASSVVEFLAQVVASASDAKIVLTDSGVSECVGVCDRADKFGGVLFISIR
jgi:hypothetical protein